MDLKEVADETPEVNERRKFNCEIIKINKRKHNLIFIFDFIEEI